MKFPLSTAIGIVLIGLFLCISFPLAATGPVTLPDINQPQFIAVDDHHFYIAENATVYIYSLKDFSLVTSFGKEGEGPREFKLRKPVTIPLVLDVQTDYLIITSMGKVSFFDKKGTFVNETRLMNTVVNPTVQPLGKGFARTKYIRDKNIRVVQVLLCDTEFKTESEVYRQPHFFQRGDKLNPLKRPLFITTDDSAGHLVVDTGAGPIHVFDQQGKKKFSIHPPEDQVAVSELNKKEIYDFYRKDPRMKRAWNYFKNLIEIPANFPPSYVTLPADGKIYVFTYLRQKDKTQCLIYDNSGKQVKDTFVPMSHISLIEAFPLYIHKNKLYQLVENFDEEEWQLHITTITE